MMVEPALYSPFTFSLSPFLRDQVYNNPQRFIEICISLTTVPNPNRFNAIPIRGTWPIIYDHVKDTIWSGQTAVPFRADRTNCVLKFTEKNQIRIRKLYNSSIPYLGTQWYLIDFVSGIPSPYHSDSSLIHGFLIHEAFVDYAV